MGIKKDNDEHDIYIYMGLKHLQIGVTMLMITTHMRTMMLVYLPTKLGDFDHPIEISNVIRGSIHVNSMLIIIGINCDI